MFNSLPTAISRYCLLMGIVCMLYACHAKENEHGLELFSELYKKIDQKEFISAKSLFNSRGEDLSEPHRLLIGALLDNAFNQVLKSEKKVYRLRELTDRLPDSLNLRLYQLWSDNAIKQFRYSEAAEVISEILERFPTLILDQELEEWENARNIWIALGNVPAQTIHKSQKSILHIEKDIVGLNRLPVSVDKDTLPFVFDTGANLSTTSQSIASRMHMRIIPASIEVGTITGDKVSAQLAVCPYLSLGSIEVENAIFLVLPDEALSFPQMQYQIFGILGYPILEGLGEIRISRSGYFEVPEQETIVEGSSNLALDGLSPLIFLDGKPFTLDTGADHSLLFYKYFRENQNEIESEYQITKIQFGGAGGQTELPGYEIDFTMNILGTHIDLENVPVLTEKVEDTEVVYGNVGQDVIGRFETMILNFNQMFIKFE